MEMEKEWRSSVGAEEINYRHELKFLCREKALFLLEDKVRRICRQDPHVGEDGSYKIRSLYFDTFDNQCYRQNEAGVDDRKKYRIRIYNDDPDVIKLECKYSRHNMKGKQSCTITREQCEYLIHGNAVKQTDAGQELLGRFLLEKKMELLLPKVIVEYVRTPYVYEAGNVRVTFDRKLRSSPAVSEFLNKRILWKGVLPEGLQLLEVKYDRGLPAAILEILRTGQDLSRSSFSKYALCRKYGYR